MFNETWQDKIKISQPKGICLTPTNYKFRFLNTSQVFKLNYMSFTKEPWVSLHVSFRPKLNVEKNGSGHFSLLNLPL